VTFAPFLLSLGSTCSLLISAIILMCAPLSLSCVRYSDGANSANDNESAAWSSQASDTEDTANSSASSFDGQQQETAPSNSQVIACVRVCVVCVGGMGRSYYFFGALSVFQAFV
jgi:hypothetical protein